MAAKAYEESASVSFEENSVEKNNENNQEVKHNLMYSKALI